MAASGLAEHLAALAADPDRFHGDADQTPRAMRESGRTECLHGTILLATPPQCANNQAHRPKSQANLPRLTVPCDGLSQEILLADTSETNYNPKENSGQYAILRCRVALAVRPIFLNG